MIRHEDSCLAPLLFRHGVRWRTIVKMAEVAPSRDWRHLGTSWRCRPGNSPPFRIARSRPHPSIEESGLPNDSPTQGGSSTRSEGPRSLAALAA